MFQNDENIKLFKLMLIFLFYNIQKSIVKRVMYIIKYNILFVLYMKLKTDDKKI